jgi:2-methylcitrate dehydratase PrpD
MLNAAAVHQVELGDGLPGAGVHPSTATVPTALALSEREGASGKSLLRAVVLAAEVLIRFGLVGSTNPDRRDRGEPFTNVNHLALPIMLAPLGSATATALILRSDSARLHNAWGIAASLGSHTPHALTHDGGDGGISKGALMGIACQAGIRASELAHAGLPGMDDFIGSWFPLWRTTFDPRRFTEDLGTRYAMTSLRYKFYATAGTIHPSLEATFAILEEEPRFEAEDVADVLVDGFGHLVNEEMAWGVPRSPEAARFNLAYCVAEAIVTRDRGAFLYDAFTPEHFQEPQRVALLAKVRRQLDPEFDALYPARAKSRVTITLRDGRVFQRVVDRADIVRQYQPTRDQVAEKFAAAAEGLLPASSVRGVIDAVWSLDEQDDLTRLWSHLSAAK